VDADPDKQKIGPGTERRDKRKGFKMHSYKYLIVGGGMTADAAIRGIRELDEEGSIGLISSEQVPPYDRPPLTKGLWKDEAEEDEIWRDTGELAVELHLNRQVMTADADEKTVYDNQDGQYHYEKLLLATGGEPRTLPEDDGSVIYYRTYKDYQLLRDELKSGSHCLVVGGGFIGSEIAAALSINDHEVTIVFPGLGIGGGLFPPDHARFLNDYYRERGVEIRTEERVESAAKNGEAVRVRLGSGEKISSDIAIAGLGIEPNTDLAEELGLEISDGIHVNKSLQTSNGEIFAAGDVASFYNEALGKRLRVEHEDNANTMGRLAGRSMAGDDVDYDYLPYFYSDLFDQGYEAVGDFDPSLEVISIWQEPHEKGLIAYMDANDLKGVVLWNVWGKVDAARELITSDQAITRRDLQARLLESQSGD
jgi:NADPH-dependent 2,4-dienoyl-CoA reductase/sulfur reductase-like enzyme